MVITERLNIHTKGQGDVVDVTSNVTGALAGTSLSSGTVTVFVIGSTATVTTIEFEPGAVADLGRALEQIAPRAADYQHHLRWGDDNGSGHVRASLMGPSVTVPFERRALLLGTWQQLVLVECDTRPRHREIVLQFIGE
jgi:secondary thiamine-phosphate synthase enzyme